MKKSTERFIEVFLLVTLPIAISAGCAGSNGNVVKANQPEEISYTDYESPVTQNELESYSLIKQEVITAKIHEAEANVEPEEGMVGPMIPESVKLSSSNIDDTNLLNVTLDSTSEISSRSNEDSVMVSKHTLLPEQNTYYFDSEKCKVMTEDYYSLKLHADFLLDNPDIMLSINGYSDHRGPETYNKKLSEKRAEAIAKLFSQFGVPDTQLLIIGHGEIAANSELPNQVEDRRVELEYASKVLVSTR